MKIPESDALRIAVLGAKHHAAAAQAREAAARAELAALQARVAQSEAQAHDAAHEAILRQHGLDPAACGILTEPGEHFGLVVDARTGQPLPDPPALKVVPREEPPAPDVAVSPEPS